MENDKLQAVVEELQDQKKYLKKQTRLLQLCSLALVLLIVVIGAAAVSIAPRISSVLTKTETIAQNLEDVTTELGNADIPGMLTNVNTLVSDSQDTVAEALKQMQSIDFESLNEAIQGLNQVVGPLASLFSR
jgi:methyl-accepting chemotaxis protein